MKVSCILAVGELDAKPTDLIVFPEGVCIKEIEEAMSVHPDAVIVAAYVENGHSRGVLWHQGRNRIDYLKVCDDGRTGGTENLQQNPTYSFGDTCIGVLICMDIDHIAFSLAVIQKLKSSKARSKYLCVPADMGSAWFSEDCLPFPQRFEGIHVILCNHIKTHQVRCKSFITDTDGMKIVVQRNEEPIHRDFSRDTSRHD